TQTTGTSQLTVEAWVKFDQLGGTIASAWQTGIATQWYLIATGDGEVEAAITDNATHWAWGCCSFAPSYGRTVGANLQTNQWYHVAFVYDGQATLASDQLKIYVDEQPQVTILYGLYQSYSAAMSQAQPTLRLGLQENLWHTRSLKGKLDDVRIYATARN